MPKLPCVLLVVMAATQCVHQAAAVKRTMPMLGMDEEGEEVDSDEDDLPATEQPRSAVQALINGLLGQVRALPCYHVAKRLATYSLRGDCDRLRTRSHDRHCRQNPHAMVHFQHVPTCQRALTLILGIIHI